MAKTSCISKTTAVLSSELSSGYGRRILLNSRASRLMREYFAKLGESAHPESSDPRARAITKFQELLLVSFREFSIISDDTIVNERRRYRSEIVNSIESFSKRSAIRNLKTLGRFTKDQAGLIYDALFKAICVIPPPATSFPAPTLLTTKDGGEERPETRIGLRTFKVFLSEICTWARDERVVTNGVSVRRACCYDDKTRTDGLLVKGRARCRRS